MEYFRAGLPWFDYYDDRARALKGSEKLHDLQSVSAKGDEKGDVPLPENESFTPSKIVNLRRGLRPGQVRESKL